MTLDQLRPGQSGRIRCVGGSGALRRHLLDMGLTPGTEVRVQKIAPVGDPLQLRLRGYELILRREEAKTITLGGAARAVQPIGPFPGPGTGGRGQHYSYGRVLPAGRPLRLALAGNQNCGKTTLFNEMTGANLHTGNFPGVTVERKDGEIRGCPGAIITDLPGIYSLSPYSGEEIVARNFLLEERPDGIINIVDATNLERSLYLTLQLLELDRPMVLALNMMDEVQANGGSVRAEVLERVLGIPVIPISAAKDQGIGRLVERAVAAARSRQRPEPDRRREPQNAVSWCLDSGRRLLGKAAAKAGIPPAFAASKLLERDPLVAEALKLPEKTRQAFETAAAAMEAETGLDRETALAGTRFDFLEALCRVSVTRPCESREHRRSAALDRVLTGRYTAFGCFAAVMGLLFFATFRFPGAWLSERLAGLVAALTWRLAESLEHLGAAPMLRSLVVDGICPGVGSVLSFLPTVLTLFFCLAVLEDTGYAARAAFVLDRPMGRLGLSGRSLVPMLMGFGCSVPAILAARTLPEERDRLITVFLIPFMSCSAKLPIYAMMAAAFFPRACGSALTAGLYLLGILCGLLWAWVLRKTRFPGTAAPLVMELPNYRLPSGKTMVRMMRKKAGEFLQKVFTVIFTASILIWFLRTFDGQLRPAAPEDSMLAALGSLLAPVFAPLGFGDWRAATAVLSGLTAKESVVSTLTLLTGGDVRALSTVFLPPAALAFLVFLLLYTPCAAALAVMRREVGTGKMLAAAAVQWGIAWAVAFLVRQIGLVLWR